MNILLTVKCTEKLISTEKLFLPHCLPIPVREFRSLPSVTIITWCNKCINECVVQYACLFGVLRENALGTHDIMYAGHYEKSLCSDDDLCCHLRKMKITSSDWITLLRRLLIFDNQPSWKCIKFGAFLWNVNIVVIFYFKKQLYNNFLSQIYDTQNVTESCPLKFVLVH